MLFFGLSFLLTAAIESPSTIKFKIIFMLLLLITTTDQVPKSRKSILQTADGAVMPAGVLANIDNLNYDYLVHNV